MGVFVYHLESPELLDRSLLLPVLWPGKRVHSSLAGGKTEIQALLVKSSSQSQGRGAMWASEAACWLVFPCP